MYSSIRSNFAESEGLDIRESILDSASKDLTRNRNKVENKTAEALKKERERLEKEKEKKRKKKEKQKNPWNKVMSRWAVLGPQKVSNVDEEKGKAFNRSQKGDEMYGFLYQESKRNDTASQAAAASAAAKARLKFDKEVSKPRRRRRRKSDVDPELLRLKMEEENARLVGNSTSKGGAAAGRGGIKFIDADDDDAEYQRQQAELQKNAKRGFKALRIASKALAMMAARADFNWQTRIQLVPHHRIDLFFDSNDTATATGTLRPLVSQWVIDIHRTLDRPFFLWLSDWKDAEGKLFCLDGRANAEQYPHSPKMTSSSSASSSRQSSFTSASSAGHPPVSPTTINRAASAREVGESSFMMASMSHLDAFTAERQQHEEAKLQTLTRKQRREQLRLKIEQETKLRRKRATAGYYSADRLPIHHPDREATDNVVDTLPKLEPSVDNFVYPHKIATVDPLSTRDFAMLRPSTECYTEQLQLGEQRTHLCTPTLQQVMQTTWLSAEIQKSQANQKLLDMIFTKHERTLGRVVTRCFFAALHGDRSLLLGLQQFKQFAKKARVGIVNVEPWKTYGITKEDDNLEELVKKATSGDGAAMKEVRAAVAAAAKRKQDLEESKLARKRSLSKKDLMGKNQPTYVSEMKQEQALNATVATSPQEEGNSGVLVLLPILYNQLSRPYNGLSIASFALALVFLSEMLYRPAELSKEEDDEDEEEIDNNNATFLTQTTNKNNSTTAAPSRQTSSMLEKKNSSFLGSRKGSTRSVSSAIKASKPTTTTTTAAGATPLNQSFSSSVKNDNTLSASQAGSFISSLRGKDQVNESSTSQQSKSFRSGAEKMKKAVTFKLSTTNPPLSSDVIPTPPPVRDVTSSFSESNNNNNNNSSSSNVNDLSLKSPPAEQEEDELTQLFSSHVIRHETSAEGEDLLDDDDDDSDDGDKIKSQKQFQNQNDDDDEEEQEPALEYPEGTTDHEILCDTFVIFIRNHLLPFLDTCFPWYADPDISVITTIPKVHTIVHREYRGMLKQLFALSSQTPTETDQSKYKDLKKRAERLKQKSKNYRNSPSQDSLAGGGGETSGDFSNAASPASGNSPLSPTASIDSFSPPHQHQQQQQYHHTNARLMTNQIEDTLRPEDRPEEPYPEITNNVMSGVVLARLLQSIAHFTHLSQKDEKIIEATEQMMWAVSLQHANHVGKTQMREQWAQGHQCSPVVLWENAAIRAANVDAGLINRSERNVSLVDYFKKNQAEAKETKPAAVADYTEPLDSIVVCYDGFLEALARMAILSEIGRPNSLRFPRLDQIENAISSFFKRKVYYTARDIFSSQLVPRDEMRASSSYEKNEGACVVRSVRLVARSNLLKEGPSTVHFHQVDIDSGALECCFHRSLSVSVKTTQLGDRAGSFVIPPLKQLLKAINRNVEVAARSSHKNTPMVQHTPHVVNFRVTGRLISQSSLAIRVNFVHIFELAFGSFGKKWTAVPIHNVHETSEINPPFAFTTPTSMFHREETAIFLRTRELILSSPPDATASILRFARSLAISARRCVSILLEASLFGDVTKENVKELVKLDEIGFALAQLLLGWNMCEVRKDSPLLPGNDEDESDDDSDHSTSGEDSDEDEDDDKSLTAYKFGQSFHASSAEINFFASDDISSMEQEQKQKQHDDVNNTTLSNSSRRKSSTKRPRANLDDLLAKDFDPSKSMVRRLRRHSLNAENFAAPKAKSKLITSTEALDMLVGGDAAKSLEWLQLMKKSKCQVHPLMADNTEDWLDAMPSYKLERTQSIEDFAAEFVQDLLFCDAAWVARHEHKVLKFLEEHRGDSRHKAFERSLARHREDRSGSIIDTFGYSSFLGESMASGSFMSSSSPNTSASVGDGEKSFQQQFSEHLAHSPLFTAPSRQMILFATQILKSAASAYRFKRSATAKMSGVLMGRLASRPNPITMTSSLNSNNNNSSSNTPRPPSSPSASTMKVARRRTSLATPGFRVGNATSSPAALDGAMLSPTSAIRRNSSASSLSSPMRRFSSASANNNNNENTTLNSSTTIFATPDSPAKRGNSFEQISREIFNQTVHGVRVKRTYFDRSLVFSMLTTAVSTETAGWSYLVVSRGRILASIGCGDEFGDVMFYRQEKDPASFSVVNTHKRVYNQQQQSTQQFGKLMSPAGNKNNNSTVPSDFLSSSHNINNDEAAKAELENAKKAMRKIVTFSSTSMRRRGTKSTIKVNDDDDDDDDNNSLSTDSDKEEKNHHNPSERSNKRKLSFSTDDDDQETSQYSHYRSQNRQSIFKRGHHLLSAHQSPADDTTRNNGRALPVGTFFSVHGGRTAFIWTRPFCPGGDAEIRNILDLASRRTSFTPVEDSNPANNSSPTDRNSVLLGDVVKRSTQDKKDLQLVGSSSFSNLVPFSRGNSLFSSAAYGVASSAIDHIGHPTTCRVYKIFLEDKLKSCFTPTFLFGVLVETHTSVGSKPFSGPFSTLSFQIPHFNASNFALTLYSTVPLHEVIGWYHEYVLNVSSEESSESGNTVSITSDETTFGSFTVQDAYQPAVVACALHLFREHSRDDDATKLRQDLVKRGFIVTPQVY